jgi:MFS family permease
MPPPARRREIAPPAPVRSRSLLRREHGYARLLASLVITGLGTQINRVAVLSVIYQTTHSSFIIAVSLVVRMGAVVVAGPLIAVVADRFPRRRVMLGSDLACSAAAVALIGTTSRGGLPGLLVLIGLLEALSALFSATRSAALPMVVTADDLPVANGMDQSSVGFVTALGSFCGGVIVAVAGTSIAFVVNAFTFLASFALVASVALPGVGAGRQRVGLRAASSAIRRSRALVYAIGLAALWPLAGGVLSVLMTIYAYRTFDAGAGGVGMLYGALGVGYFVGGLAARRVFADPARLSVSTAAVTYTIEGACYVVVSVAPTIWLAIIALVTGTCAAAAGNTALASVVMTRSPDDLRGGVFAINQTLASAAQMAAMLAAGVLLGLVSPRLVGLGSGLFLMLICLGLLAAYRRPARRLATGDQPAGS